MSRYLLGITTEHILKLDRLPKHHQDPFDRILTAQMLVEKCTVVTADEKIKKYDTSIIG